MTKTDLESLYNDKEAVALRRTSAPRLLERELLVLIAMLRRQQASREKDNFNAAFDRVHNVESAPDLLADIVKGTEWDLQETENIQDLLSQTEEIGGLIAYVLIRDTLRDLANEIDAYLGSSAEYDPTSEFYCGHPYDPANPYNDPPSEVIELVRQAKDNMELTKIFGADAPHEGEGPV